MNVQISPNIVDVNVHPTKIEVRFSDNKIIYESVFFAVKNALLQFDEPNDIKFENKRNYTNEELYDFPPPPDQNEQLKFETISSVKAVTNNTHSENRTISETFAVQSVPASKSANEASEFADEIKSDYISDKSTDTVKKDDYETHFDAGNQASPPYNNFAQQEDVSEYKYINQNAFEKKESAIIVDEVKPEVKPVVIGELFKTYIVAQSGDDMLLFDKHAAHERYIFEQIKNDAQQLDTQMYLEPIMVLLSYEEYDALSCNLEKIKQLGFAVEPDVAPTVAVTGVPMVLKDENPTEIVTELAENFIECRHNPQLEIFVELFHSIACKAAIKANDNSGLIELQALVNAVFENDNIRYCPHGRPVMIKLSKKDIEKQFKRIV